VIPAAFEYERAATLAAALKAVGTRNTKVMCGGQSLIPLLRFRLTQVKRIVDIGHLKQLQGVSKAKGVIRIGAATTYRALLDAKVLRDDCPLLAEVTERIGDRQVRNIGTIGGGLAHADPSADMPGAMLALDAQFVVRSAKGKRTVAARDWFRGPFESAMKAGELLTDITITVPARGTGAAYESFEQAASGYPLVGAAAVVTRAKGKVTAAALAFTGLGEVPFLATGIDKLVGTDGGTAAVAKVAAASAAGVDANEDIHASAEYRLHLAKVAARRALLRALERAG
jgi:carbon-monoxide dehydrogenase medium subunit